MELAPEDLHLFWCRTQKSEGCWEWQGFVTDKGYGRIRIRGCAWLAHRLSYAIHFGPIPKGLKEDWDKYVQPLLDALLTKEQGE